MNIKNQGTKLLNILDPNKKTRNNKTLVENHSTHLVVKVNSKAIDILNLLDERGKKQFMPSIGPIKGKIVADIIRKYEPKKILEIGSLYGYSAILMSSVMSS